jgi:hypothetical protein
MSESATQHQTDSRYAAMRLVVAVLLMTLGASGMYVVPVALPPCRPRFGVARADASMPYALLMIGFGIGGLLMGRLADRFGVMVPLLIGALSIGAGFVLAGNRRRSGPSARARAADRAARQLRDVLAAARRHLALVGAPPRHGGGDLRERQLPRRRVWPPIVQR